MHLELVVRVAKRSVKAQGLKEAMGDMDRHICLTSASEEDGLKQVICVTGSGGMPPALKANSRQRCSQASCSPYAAYACCAAAASWFEPPVRARRLCIGGSLIGSIKETQEMLDLCGEKNITCDVEVRCGGSALNVTLVLAVL